MKKFLGWLKYILDKKDKELRKDLKKILGFYPINIDYYKTAFIHKSASYIDHFGKVVNNERLEFLGDAILDAVVGDFLFKKYPAATEGFLTQTRSKLVNRAILTELAHKIGLDKFIIIHIKKYTNHKHIPGNALEAFIGAVYLDVGYNLTKQFIEKKLYYKHLDIEKIIFEENNYKSKILEWGQHEKIKVEFNTEPISDQPPIIFKSQIFINEKLFGEGIGNSKKEAEQNAAKIAYKKLTSINFNINNGNQQ